MKVRNLVALSPLFIVVGCVVGQLGGDAFRPDATAADDAGEPCSDDPFKCKPGNTCWPAIDGGATCVASKSYKLKGTDCEMLLGRSSCADNLVCITLDKPLDAGMDTGKEAAAAPKSEPISLCAPWCDDKHPCPPGETCRVLSFAGFSAKACIPPNLEPADSGMPDTMMPDTNKPDTNKPDTTMPDMGMETTVTDSTMETAPDTAMPETMADTTPVDTAMPDTSVSDSSDAD